MYIVEEIINGIIYITEYNSKGEVVCRSIKPTPPTEEEIAEQKALEEAERIEAELNKPATNEQIMMLLEGLADLYELQLGGIE